MTCSTSNRVVASFMAIATGDAIGKQTEGLPYEDIPGWYPQGIRGFEGTPGAIIAQGIINEQGPGTAYFRWHDGALELVRFDRLR